VTYARLVSLKIDIYNIVRTVDRNNKIDIETCWGKLGYIDDWFIERVEIKQGDWSPSLSTLKSVYRRRRKPLSCLYSIGHRRGERIYSRPGGPRLAKRRKISKVNPWTGYIVSYLEDRRVKRILESPRYDPTDKDIENILLPAAPFVQTRNRRFEEDCWCESVNQRLF
jgi:hypothetical protein